jgi:(p)ppGpp synthase/HD superfamily hydrolase
MGKFDKLIEREFLPFWYYAKLAHRNGFRKEGSHSVPQCEHLAEVHLMVLHHFDSLAVRDIGMKMFRFGLGIVSLLHDLLEDTDVTREVLEKDLLQLIPGDSVADKSVRHVVLECVCSLTDVFTKEAYPDLNRAERKKRETLRLAACSYPEIVHPVKMCDHISNYYSIRRYDPKFSSVYKTELTFSTEKLKRDYGLKHFVNEVLTTGSSRLYYEAVLEKLMGLD